MLYLPEEILLNNLETYQDKANCHHSLQMPHKYQLCRKSKKEKKAKIRPFALEFSKSADEKLLNSSLASITEFIIKVITFSFS